MKENVSEMDLESRDIKCQVKDGKERETDILKSEKHRRCAKLVGE